MPTSKLALAKRAFVSVLLELARTYDVPTDVTRDSPDTVLLQAYKKVALKAHPDKGGSDIDQARLFAARDRWEEAKTNGAPRWLGASTKVCVLPSDLYVTVASLRECPKERSGRRGSG